MKSFPQTFSNFSRRAAKALVYSRVVRLLECLFTGFFALTLPLEAGASLPDAASPAVTTGAASDLTASTATLNGNVAPNGSQTSVLFQYGTSSSYGSATAAQSVGDGSVAVAVKAALTGLHPATTYHFRAVAIVRSTATSGGPNAYYDGADQTFTTAFLPQPVVTTGAATDITTTAALLNGTVTPNGNAVSVLFQYGTTSSYGSATAAQSVGDGSVAVAVKAVLTGLHPATEYHFRAVAITGSTATGSSTSAAYTYGADQTFTTVSPPPPPVVTTGAATEITTTAAILNGTVTPNGNAVSVLFQYGTSSSYGSSTAAQSVGDGSVAVAVKAVLTALHPATEYHFRAVAISGSTATGSSTSVTYTYGADQTFTTVSPPPPPVVTTGAATEITTTAAILSGTVTPNGNAVSVLFQYGTSSSYGSSTAAQSVGDGSVAVAVKAALTGLHPATEYHFRTVAIIASTATNISTSASYTYGADQTFTTASLPKPVVTTGAATEITTTAALLNGTVTPNGNAVSVLFQYGTTSSYGSATASQSVGDGSVAVAVKAALTGLHPATEYHFRTVAIIASTATNSSTSASYTYGADQTFTTASLPKPVVTTGAASDVTTTTAILNGTVTPNGNAVSVLFQYGTSSTYGSSTAAQSVGDGSVAVAVKAALTGLHPATTYHFRAVAIVGSTTTSVGTNAYYNGADQTFTTASLPQPVVTTGAATEVTTTTAILNGTVIPNGNAVSVLFQYGTTSSYGSLTAAQSVGDGSVEVAVKAVLTALHPATEYHFRVVAIIGSTATGSSTSASYTYGADQKFTTVSPPPPPVVTTGAASDVTTTTAILNGTVTPNGNAVSVLFQYGTSSTYGSSTAAQSVGDGSVAVAVKAALTGLHPATEYHFRTVAITASTATNSGTSASYTYGADQTFTTASLPKPVVTTGAATEVTATAAILNGTVTPNGNAVTVLFQYGTSSSYGSSTAAQSVGDGSVAVAVKAALTGLHPATEYHFRTVAITASTATNSGTSASYTYGADQTFTTASLPKPVVTTGAATEVTATSAILNGTVMPNGNALTVLFQYGTTSSYGSATAAQSVGDGSVAVAVKAVLTGLHPATEYHFRVVAIGANASGVVTSNAYVDGADQTFTTLTTSTTPRTASETVSREESKAIAKGVVDIPASHPGGVYNGLVTNAAPANANSGYVRIVCTDHGAFSGRIEFAGHAYPLKGMFDASGDFTTTIGSSASSALSVTLNLRTTTGAQMLSGTISSGETASTLLAPRSPYGSVAAPSAGRYRVVFSAPTGTSAADLPSSDGFALMTVGSEGSITLVGRLGDGSAISAAATLDGNGTFPLYAGLYSAPRGSVFGTVKFRSKDAVSDCDGSLLWFKPGKIVPGGGSAGPLADRVYPAGFATSTDLFGSPAQP